jgi:histidinol-phosphate aminotransferase
VTPFPRPAYGPLTRYAPDRRPVEVDLSDNTSRFGAHPGVLHAIRSASEEDVTRYPAVYADALRSAVSERYAVPVENVTTGCGSDDLLDSAFRAAGEPGDRIAYAPPTFSMIEIFARMNAMVPSPVHLRPEDDPRALLEGAPALVYLCRPNNPTGDSWPRARVRALLDAAGPSGPIILLDEAYADFADDAFLQDAVTSRRLLVVRTLSKAFGMAGLRVGFAVGPAEVILEVEKSRGPYKVTRLSERAAVAALRDEERWVPNLVAEVRRERARLLEELGRRGLSPLPSQANFVLLPLQERSSAEVTAALRTHGVAVRPFPNLPEIGDTIRISVGSARDIDSFLGALDDVLESPSEALQARGERP